MKIGIALLTNYNIHNEVRNLSFEINCKYGTSLESTLLPQHISLKQSFDYNGDIDALENYLNSILSNFTPFTITSEKVEVKKMNDSNVLCCLKIKESKKLRTLHNDICEGLKKRFEIEPLEFDGDMWTFHSTITMGKIDSASLDKLFNEYNNKKFVEEFDVDKVVLFFSYEDENRITRYYTKRIYELRDVFAELNYL